MLQIQIHSYDESTDSFECYVTNSLPYPIHIPGTLMPYIAPAAVAACESLPFDMVGKRFEMTSPLVAA